LKISQFRPVSVLVSQSRLSLETSGRVSVLISSWTENQMYRSCLSLRP